MKSIAVCILGLNCLFAVVSCGSSQYNYSSRVIRQAENPPTSFSPQNGIKLDSNSCKSPMIDPRDGTEILMVSASSGEGNYKVPVGKYGVQKGELLRLNCRTGEVIGIVKGSQ